MHRILLPILFFTILLPPSLSLSLTLESNELIKSFKMKGKLISPRIIYLFEKYEKPPSDAELVSIDVTDSDWDTTIKTDKDGDIGFEKDPWKDEQGFERSGGSFFYKYEGMLPNGVHVLKTFDSGGGSGTYNDLMFFVLHKDSIYRDKIILRHIESVDLGDRVGDRAVLIGGPDLKEENEIFVGPSSRFWGMLPDHSPCFKVIFEGLKPTYHDLLKCDDGSKG